MPCGNDETLGPAVTGCRDDFDFTVTFEHVLLTIIPAILFIVLCIGRFLSLRGRRAIVRGEFFRWIKLGVAACLALIHLALLVYTSVNNEATPGHRASSIAAAALSCLAMTLSVPLSVLEHSLSARPSVLLGAYLSTTLLFDIAHARTAWLLVSSSSELLHARLVTSACALRALLLILETQPKTAWLDWDLKQHSPEETSGLYGLGAFLWLNKLFVQGSRDVLSIESLYPLDNALAAETMRARFLHRLQTASWRGRKRGLFNVLFRTLGIQLFPAIAPRIILLAASLCQPLLINALLGFLQAEDKDKTHGYGLIAATGLTYIVIALSSALYWYFQERFLIMLRGCLVVAVYEQTTSLQLSATTETGALTVMSTDVELIMRGFRDLHEYWANVIQIGLSCWLLQRQLGNAFAAPLVVVIVAALGAFGIGVFLGPRQRAWMNAIQERVSVTANAITQMKLVKMSGLSKPVQTWIQHSRVAEIALGGRWRVLLGLVATLSFVPMSFSPVMTFAVTARTLDTTTIFVSISYLTLLAAPLMVLFQKLPQLLGALTCMDRIQSFLEKSIRKDERQSPPILGSNAPTLNPTSNLVELSNLVPSDAPALSIVDGCFGWDESTIMLKDVNLEICKGDLVAVVGSVACGKTSFCKAVLGEMPVAQGIVALASKSPVGYCSQQPFLTNSSVRENVVGYGEFDQQKYTEVLEATMLDHDIETFADGDQTRVGSGAITLSGGQRQRLAIARALYKTGPQLYIFDDALSGLDAKTEEHVFHRVFGSDGMLRRRKATVLLCTHKASHLEHVNLVLRINNGTVSLHEGKIPDTLISDTSAHPTPVPAKEVPTRVMPAVGLTDEEGAARKIGDFAVYKHYLRTVGLVPVAICLFASICYGFLLNFSKVWLTFWSDDAARPEPVHSQGYYIGIYGLLEALFIGFFVVAGMTVLLVFIKTSGAALHENALETVINAPLRLFTQTDTGTITNYFAQDMTLIDGEMPLALLNMVLDICGVLGMAALLASSAPWLSLAYPPMVAVLWFIQRFYLKTSRQLRLLDLEARAPLYSHFIETLKGLDTIRALQWEADSTKHSRMLLDRSQKPAYLLAVVQRWLYFVLNMVVAVIATFLVTLITQLQGASSSLSGAALVTLMSLSAALSDIVKFYALLETTIGAVARLRNFSARSGTERTAHQVFQPDAQWPSRGAIEVNNVNASYHEGMADFVLRNISVVIQPGEKVALCGRTGSGKSSLILLLLGMLEPVQEDGSTATLSFDGVPLSSIDRQILREHLITLPQDPVFLPRGSTIAQNLDSSGIATSEQIASVAHALGLGDVLEAQGGPGSSFVELSLSHGQRQVFSLARAVLKRRLTGRRILLLDEFTSSVDVDTERSMMDVVRREFESCTVVMIAHRLDMVADMCDRVLVMDQGTIVEAGDPRVLRRMEETRFASLLGASSRD